VRFRCKGRALALKSASESEAPCSENTYQQDLCISIGSGTVAAAFFAPRLAPPLFFSVRAVLVAFVELSPASSAPRFLPAINVD
jgi:hypothetical protein